MGAMCAYVSVCMAVAVGVCVCVCRGLGDVTVCLIWMLHTGCVAHSPAALLSQVWCVRICAGLLQLLHAYQ